MSKLDTAAVVILSFMIGFCAAAWLLVFASPVFKRGNEAYGMVCVERDVRTGRCLAFAILPQTEKGS